MARKSVKKAAPRTVRGKKTAAKTTAKRAKTAVKAPAKAKKSSAKDKKKGEKATAGAPSRYQEGYAVEVEALKADGLTDKDAARRFDISTETLRAWKKKNKDFAAGYKRGVNDFVLNKLEPGLYKRAMGFTRKRVEEYFDKKGILTGSKKVTEEVLPDTTALIFALCNLDPANWKQRQEQRLQVEMPHRIVEKRYAPRGAN